MTTWHIRRLDFGRDLGTYEAPTRMAALDAMAQERGFRNFGHWSYSPQGCHPALLAVSQTENPAQRSA